MERIVCEICQKLVEVLNSEKDSVTYCICSECEKKEKRSI